MKKTASLFYSSIGVAAMFVLLVAIGFLAGRFKHRFDVTAEKAFTLSPGTKAILAKLDTPVQIRFYCTQVQNEMPVGGADEAGQRFPHARERGILENAVEFPDGPFRVQIFRVRFGQKIHGIAVEQERAGTGTGGGEVLDEGFQQRSLIEDLRTGQTAQVEIGNDGQLVKRRPRNHFTFKVFFSQAIISGFQCCISGAFQPAMPCPPPSTGINSQEAPTLCMASHMAGDCS